MSDKMIKKGNIVMKTKSIITLAAMALMMAACTSEDLTQPQTPSSKGIPFTATISGKAATRAIKENTTDGILETSWAEKEKVALVYTGSNSETVVDEMEVTEVGTDGTATIAGTITGSPADGTEVRLIYPASAANESGEVRDDLLNVQDGTLAFIAENLDLRTSSTAKLKVALGSASIDGTVSLKNQLAIVKFSLSDGSDVLATEYFEIQDGNDQPMITVEPSPAASEFYVAMYPATDQTFHFVAKKGDEKYSYSKSGVTLEASKYYQSPLVMSLPAPEKQAGSISYATKTVEKETTDGNFTNALTKVGDGKVTYSSDKESVATVNQNGQVTIKGAGEATITATVEDSDTYAYAEKTATYKLKVSGGLTDYNVKTETDW